MKRIYVYLSIVVFVYNAYPQAKTNCLADVFPLAVGNQWTYQYSWEYEDLFNHLGDYSQIDTVTLRVIGNTSTTDSICWSIERSHNQSQSYPNDTLQLIEMCEGNHRLYYTGDINDIRHLVTPFSPFLEDSALVYRYCPVDSLNIHTLESLETSYAYTYRFTFKKGIGQTYAQVSSACPCGWTDSGFFTLLSSTITNVDDNGNIAQPMTHRLDQNFPNPFNPSTLIRFEIQKRSNVKLEIVDALGRSISTLVDEEKPRGNYEVPWNASKYASGIYFYKLTTGSEIQTRKMIFLK